MVMETRNRSIFFAKFFLIYTTLLCLLISLNFLFNIKALLNELSVISLIGLTFLSIYLFIIWINLSFFFRKRASRWPENIILYNALFCFVSGFSIRTNNWLLANNLGCDISIIFLKDHPNWRYLLHFNFWELIVKFQHEPIGDEGLGFQINLIMLAIGVFLFIYYKKERFSVGTI